MSSIYFFFFQAEDGIRDLTVTGVQTCALPIYSGTFGYKFTVQNATLTGAGSNQVWAERVAGLYNISLCPRFNGTAFTPNRSEERRVGKECRSRWSPYH